MPLFNVKHQLGRLVLASATAVMAVAGVGLLNPGHAEAFWCLTDNADGSLNTEDIRRSERDDCESDGGSVLTNTQRNRLVAADTAISDPVSGKQFLPDGWYANPGVCGGLTSTGNDGSSNPSGVAVGGGVNQISDVKERQAISLSLEIAHDIGSNELTGITGAIIGAIWAPFKISAFVEEWKYDVQAECVDILEFSKVEEIQTNTQALRTDVTAILNSLNTPGAVTLTDVDTKVMDIATAVALLGTSLTVETDEIDAALTALSSSLISETDEIDAALATNFEVLSNQTSTVRQDITNLGADLDAQTVELLVALNEETRELDAAVSDVDQGVTTAGDLQTRLLIEQQLSTCAPLVTLFSDLPSHGLLETTFGVLDSLVAEIAATGMGSGDAATFLAAAHADYNAGMNGRDVFPSLCDVYDELLVGGGAGGGGLIPQ